MNMLALTATQDLKLNTKNRDAAIKQKHIQYGPLNIDQPEEYWENIKPNIGKHLRKQLKNLYVVTVWLSTSAHEWKECMPGPVSDKDGNLGYCWMHHFKCTAQGLVELAPRVAQLRKMKYQIALARESWTERRYVTRLNLVSLTNFI